MDILEPAKRGISLTSKLAFIFGGAMVALRLLRNRQAVDFNGRVVVISGGSRGLGLCIAREFAKEGAQLALLARDEDELKVAQQQLEAMGAPVLTVVADVTDPHDDIAAINRVLERFGSVDVLINNAGIIQVGPARTYVGFGFQSRHRPAHLGATAPDARGFALPQAFGAGAHRQHRFERWSHRHAATWRPMRSPKFGHGRLFRCDTQRVARKTK